MQKSNRNLDRCGRLHVSHVVLTLDVGGLERNVVNQVREGRDLGQRVSVICMERPGALAEQVKLLGGTIISLHKRPGLRPGMVGRMRQVMRDLRPDVLHTHQIASLLYAGAAARLVGVPVVVHTEHGRERYATRLRTRLLGRAAGSLCDRYYCLTRDMADEIRERRIVTARKIRVIQNGIDVKKFTDCSADPGAVRRLFGVPPEAPLIGTVGRLTEVKRQDVLIRAFARVRQNVPAAHLLLVGDGPLLDQLRSLADGLGIGECVHFAGYQPHSGPCLQALDVFALTSRSEGMPQAVLEASVTELPVVASRVGGLPEVIQDGSSGILFEAGNDSQLAVILCDLIANPARRKQLGAAARARVESSFSVARMAAEYHRDFMELLAHAAVPHPALPRSRPAAVGTFALEDVR